MKTYDKNRWKREWPCNPTILDQDTLMTDDWEFATKEIINDKCVCYKSDVCKQIVDLLDHKQYNIALELIKTINE
jgi:hypothetical protein